ncbi:MAG: hypothetical protein PHY93_20515 [Bacteriovorax sp.]|nr:hypothetical protein [Bacteriovorax sp.]
MMGIDEITRRRASTVFELTKERLLDGDENESISEAYRFSYLVLRGPRIFLGIFGDGDLYLDFDKINNGYFMLRFDLYGKKGLSEEEEQIIDIHNEETRRLSSNT